MINAVYHDKYLMFIGAIFREKLVSPAWGSEYKLLKIFEFIKAVSDKVLNMINAVYHDKPLILSGLGSRRSSYYDKPLILSGLRFRRSSSPIIKQ